MGAMPLPANRIVIAPMGRSYTVWIAYNRIRFEVIQRQAATRPRIETGSR
jgi:hypothetical protein